MPINFLYPEYEIIRDTNKCIACRVCQRQCANEAHTFDEEAGIVLSDSAKCVNCHRCVSLCPTRALKIVKTDHTFRENGNWDSSAIIPPSKPKRMENGPVMTGELYPDKVRGVLSEAEYLDLSKHFSAELQQQKRLITDAERKIIDLDARIAAGDNRRAIIEKYINPTHLTREMVEILIDSISVGRRIAGTREVPITIYWRF